VNEPNLEGIIPTELGKEVDLVLILFAFLLKFVAKKSFV
jgi:hypothetical protein